MRRRFEDSSDPECRPAVDHGTVLDVDGHTEVSFLLPDRQECINIVLRGDVWVAALDDFGAGALDG